MTTIKLKNGSGAPTSGDLAQGEPALDLTNKRLYTEDSGGTVIEVGTNPGVDVTFADNRKAIFGAGSDLQIYHSGSASHITDSGTGNLLIQGTDVRLQNAGATANYLKGTDGAEVSLFYAGGEKLATSSTGINVTGSGIFTTADNSAQVTLISTDTDALAGPQLNLWRNSGTGTNGDLIGQITFTGEDTVGSTNTFATIYGVADQTNNGAEDGSIHFQTLINGALADRLEINSAGNSVFTGNVGIGTSSPSFPLEVDGGTGDGIKIKAGNTSNDDSFLVANSSNTTMFLVDGGGNVGIGTSSPSNPLHVATASTDVAKFATTGAYNFITLDNATRNWALSVGSTFSIYDSTAASTRMSVDSSGNLLVGTTETDIGFTASGAGCMLGPEGTLQLARNSANELLYLNKLGGNDGDIIRLSTDGNEIGVLGVRANYLKIGNGDTQLLFNSGSDAITPEGASDNRDAAIDLGRTVSRFKDLHLSGGVYLGGTAAANKLDDYEEGTFTGAVADASSGGNESSSALNGTYVKVGAVVYVQFNVSNIITTGMTAGNDVFITGLPFASKSVSGTAKYTGTANLSVVTFEQTPFMQLNEGQTYVKILEVRSGAGNDAVVVSQLSSGASDIHGNLVYQTA